MSTTCDVDSRVRSKLLLTNLEEAKRAEFERRRKLRLQQVRQQSCDFASKIRRNVSKEIRTIAENENRKKDNKCKAILENRREKLEKTLNEASASLHGAQKSAEFQNDLATIVKEKEDLQNALARARGTIAGKKEKENRQVLREKDANIIDRKSVVRQIENTRSILIARLSPAEPKPRVYPKKSSRPVVRRSKPPDSPSDELKGIIKKPVSKESVKLPPRQPSECTIASPVLVRHKLDAVKSSSENRFSDPNHLDSSGCYDSDSTWPPRSARVTKQSIPETIRVYNHNDGKCSEFIRPWKSVTHLASLTDLQMTSNLEMEVEHNILQADLEERRRKLRESRGARALKKERSRHEFETMLRDMSTCDKKERIRRAVNVEYPPEVHVRQPSGHPRKKILRFEDEEGRTCGHFHEVINPPVGENIPELNTDIEKVLPIKETRLKSDDVDHNEVCLRQIVDHIEKTREKILRQRQDSSDDEVDVPRWISDAESFQMVDPAVRATEDARVFKSSLKKKKKVKKVRQGGSKKASAKNKRKKVKSKKPVASRFLKSSIREDEHVAGDKGQPSAPKEDLDESFPFKTHPCDLSSFNEKETQDVQNETRPVGTPENSSVTSSSSSTSRDVVVTVEILGKKKKKCKKGTQTLPTVREKSPVARMKSPANARDFTCQTTPVAQSSSSTSYNSPPEHLSPDQRKMLCRALNNVHEKNKENPKLREYVGRLLTMSRQSVSDLEVSTTSELSIDSDIFNSTKAAIDSRRPERRRIHLASESSETDGSRTRDRNRSLLELLSLMAEFQNLVQNQVRPCDPDDTQSSYNTIPRETSEPPILPRTAEPPTWRWSQSRLFDRSSSSGRESDALPRSLRPQPDSVLESRGTAPSAIYRPPASIGVRPDLSTIDEASFGGPRAEPLERSPTRREMALSDGDSTISSIASPAHPRPRTRRRFILASPTSPSDASSVDLATSRDVGGVIEESSSDLEEAFRSLGLNWALSTLKRTRDSKKLSSGTSSDGRRDRSSSSRFKKGSSSGYKHSTPLVRTPEKGAEMVPQSQQEALPQPTGIPQRERLTPPNLTLSHPCLSTNPS